MDNQTSGRIRLSDPSPATLHSPEYWQETVRRISRNWDWIIAHCYDLPVRRKTSLWRVKRFNFKAPR